MPKPPKELHQYASLPMLLTDLQLLEDMERKVAWNLGQYLDSAEFGVVAPLLVAYTSIDYCIAVISYRDWIVTKWLALATYGRPPEVEDGPETVSKASLQGWLNRTVSYLQFCQEIANTAKHGQYADKENLQNPAAQSRLWLTDEGKAACEGMTPDQKWHYAAKHPRECTFDRALYAKGYTEPIKGSQVLHLPFEELRSFAALHGIR
jgi:hypothetical protein